MRIGVMLRHYDQHGGGVKVYTQRLLQAILDLRTAHEFVFLYRNPSLVGTYAGKAAVQEVAVPARSILTWDQFAVPAAVRRYGIELLYNPKYSIPLVAGCPAVWVCHGLDWYVMPWASKRIDRLSHRFLVPRYATRADAIIAVSEITRDHIIRYLPVPPDRVVTVYSGVDDVFRSPKDQSQLQEVRRRYSLPERFLLYAGAIYPPKNFRRLVQAYARVGPARGIPLVIAGGENRFLSENELEEPMRLGIAEWVRWTGWVEQDDLARFYALAEALLLPSLFESFGLPVLEAMAAGCPVVTSNRYGTRELAEGAAILVDPESVESITQGIRQILEDDSVRARLVPEGRKRSQEFTWARCASQTLGVLEQVHARHSSPGLESRRPAGLLS